MKKEFIKLKLGDIVPYDNNPRKNEEAVPDVRQSMKDVGNIDPIEVDENNVILSGHTRLVALKQLGYDSTEVVRVFGLTEKQKKKYRILANKTAEKAEWDLIKLEQEISDLDFGDYGFNFDDLKIGEALTEEVDEDGYDEELPATPKSKKGDIYQLGRHRLMCGDSTCITDVEKLMNGELADMLITDPPYNVDYTGKTNGQKILNDSMNNSEFRQFLVDAFTAADIALKPGAVFYIWHADIEGYNFRGACADIGWQVRQCLIWQKNSMVMGRQDYQWKHEPCLYGWKGGAGHLWASDRKQTTVLNFDKPLRNDIHPTMKPIKLFDYQIQNNTKPRDKVLDLFCGSGTTIMACEQDGRDAFAMELDPRYVDATINRWESFTGQKAVLCEQS